MNTPAISIIVPVYRAEDYLERCVDSILAQTFSDWELLLVDDGSPDRSPQLCDQWAARDSRIRVFHQPNGGVAAARETGVQHARSQYSIHVDPDDWIEPRTLQVLYRKAVAGQADMVVCDFLLDYGTRTEVLAQRAAAGGDFLRDLLTQEAHGSLCNKLIRTALYRRHDIHFPPEMICWEDLYVCCRLLLSGPCRVAYVPEALYHYDFHSNPNSMVRRATQRTLRGMVLFCHRVEALLPMERKAWLAPTKGLALVTAYRGRLLSAEGIRTLFPEVNDWFVRTYRHDYARVRFCATAQVLSGWSIERAHRFERWNKLWQRVRNRAHRLFSSHPTP